MKQFTIWWTGTVTGFSMMEGETLEDAIRKTLSIDFERPITIELYPDDWEVDVLFTKQMEELE